MNRYYICGPMTGYPDCNRPAFRAVREALRLQGNEVIDPSELDLVTNEASPSGSAKYLLFLVRDVSIILSSEIDAMVALSGWERSKGARLEIMAGRVRGLPVLDARTMLELPVTHLDLVDLMTPAQRQEVLGHE